MLNSPSGRAQNRQQNAQLFRLSSLPSDLVSRLMGEVQDMSQGERAEVLELRVLSLSIQMSLVLLRAAEDWGWWHGDSGLSLGSVGPWN